MSVPPIYAAMTARRLYSHVDFDPMSALSPGFNSHHPIVYKQLDLHGLRLRDDGFVEWKDEEPQLPRNWTFAKKAFNNILVCLFEFWIMALSSSGTAASVSGPMEFSTDRTYGYFAFTSLYLFGQATGSIFCSVLSETFGRRTLYLASTAIYCIFTAVVAAAPSYVAVALGRFITGAASAIPAAVAFGSFEDMHSSETRAWIVYTYTMAGNCGLMLGPIYSAYVSNYFGWRWVFYISTVVSALGTIASVFMHETRAGYLLELKIKQIEKRIGNRGLRISDKQKITLTRFAKENLLRPMEFLFTEPIVICCAVLMMISFSLIYGFTEGLIMVYTEFGFSQSTTSSLAFLPLLLGLVINIIPRVYERQGFDHQRDNAVPNRAETSARSLLISCPSLAFGLWLFAWTIPPQALNAPWIISMAGLVFIGYATNDFAYVLFVYLTGSYGKYAPSACAALNLSRTLMGAIFPLFTYTMYSTLGGNLSTSIFAVIATVFCATPLLFIRYGRQLRKLSRFAHTEEDDHDRRGFSDAEKDVQVVSH